jgi:hypothetical protein
MPRRICTAEKLSDWLETTCALSYELSTINLNEEHAQEENQSDQDGGKRDEKLGIQKAVEISAPHVPGPAQRIQGYANERGEYGDSFGNQVLGVPAKGVYKPDEKVGFDEE